MVRMYRLEEITRILILEGVPEEALQGLKPLEIIAIWQQRGDNNA